MNEKSKEIYEKLSAPFQEMGVDGKMYFTHKWKPDHIVNGKFECTPFLDARQVADRLNAVLGLDGWSDNLEEITAEGIICNISAIIDGKEISRSDIGMFEAKSANTQKIKSKAEASDSLKRAAVKLGVGAYIYSMEPVSLDVAV